MRVRQGRVFGKTAEEWDSPREEDFPTDDLGEIDDHFVLSASGFPAAGFTDLKLPVVDPDGNLNENALQAAHGGAHSVETIDDIDDETKQDVKDLFEDLSQEEFDEGIGTRIAIFLRGENPAVYGGNETRSVSFAHQNPKRSGDGRESDTL